MLDYVAKLDTVGGSRDVVREKDAEDAYIEDERGLWCGLGIPCSSVVMFFSFALRLLFSRLEDCSYRKYFTISS